MSLVLRDMCPADLDQVMAIDRHCFRPPWPRHSWRHELDATNTSHLVVLGDGTLQRGSGWRGHLRLRPARERVLGYAGMWLAAGEAHVSTLATHPQQRGKGYGELLLVALLRRALTRHADIIVLEVRRSNRVARNLYEKYGFRLYGIKRGYYREGNEDGCDMRIELADPAARTGLLQRCAAIRARLSHVDCFNPAPAPFRN